MKKKPMTLKEVMAKLPTIKTIKLSKQDIAWIVKQVVEECKNG